MSHLLDTSDGTVFRFYGCNTPAAYGYVQVLQAGSLGDTYETPAKSISIYLPLKDVTALRVFFETLEATLKKP